MPDSNKTAAQFLEEVRKERDELNILVEILEKRLGISAGSQASEPDLPAASPRVSLSTDSLPVGFFHNLSQAAAAEKLLRMSPNNALSTTEILEAFRKSGMDISGKNAITILYTALKRSPKFERVAGKAWGLAEWYPEGRKKKDQTEKAERNEAVHGIE
jgi:hypothetical protein